MRADRRKLADGEFNGDGQGTKMTPSSLRVDWWHKRDQPQPGPSMTSAMAATTVRLRYASDRRPVECKQKAQRGSAAHHEDVGAKSEAGE